MHKNPVNPIIKIKKIEHIWILLESINFFKTSVELIIENNKIEITIRLNNLIIWEKFIKKIIL